MDKVPFSPITADDLKQRFAPLYTPKGIEGVTVWGKNCPNNENTNLTIRLWDSKQSITENTAAGFTMRSYPACCGILVSCRSFVHSDFRRRGVGTLMQEIKEYIARQYRVGKLTATVIQGNAAEEALLLKTGWAPGPPFRNERTGNTVVEWEKVLQYPTYAEEQA